MVTRPVGFQLLVGVAVAVGVLGWVLQRFLAPGAGLPGPSWATAVLLLVMAAGLYWAGLPVKRWRTARVPVSPIRAARTLVLAQAAALTGSGLIGWYAAQVMVLLPDLDVESQRSRVWLILAVVLASALLVVSGLLVQRMCRIDDDELRPPDDQLVDR